IFLFQVVKVLLVHPCVEQYATNTELRHAMKESEILLQTDFQRLHVLLKGLSFSIDTFLIAVQFYLMPALATGNDSFMSPQFGYLMILTFLRKTAANYLMILLMLLENFLLEIVFLCSFQRG